MLLSRDGLLRCVHVSTIALGLGLAGCSSHSGRNIAHRNVSSPQINIPVAVTEFSEKSLKDATAETEEPEWYNSKTTIQPVQFEPSPTFANDDVDTRLVNHFEDEAASQSSGTYSINFSTALALVSGQNPRVGFAQARISEAFARVDAAEALWLPSIRAGASYNKHEGSLQEVRGNVFDVSRGSTYAGLGAQAAGTGSPRTSGLWAQFHLADAIFQPIIAERTAAARQHAATATTNDVLLETALAYLNLLQAIQEQSIADNTVGNTRRLANLTTSFAKAGQGSQADADRVQVELALRQNNISRAVEKKQVASYRLAEVLSLDAGLKIDPTEPTVAPIDLIPLNSSANELLATALSNRPELSESRLLVSEAAQRLKRERYAPLIPSVLLGLSYGGFGGDTGGNIDNYKDRFDLDAVAYWEVRNLGFGEKAARDEARARISQAKFREIQVMDRVAREVAEAFAQTKSRKRQISVAKSGIKAAGTSYTRNLERIRQNEGLPIEALQAIQALDQARREYLRTIIDYNDAQFRLYRALGCPIQQL